MSDIVQPSSDNLATFAAIAYDVVKWFMNKGEPTRTKLGLDTPEKVGEAIGKVLKEIRTDR